MLRFFYKLVRRLPYRVRAFLPKRFTIPSHLTPAERTFQVMSEFGQELRLDSPVQSRGLLKRVFQAAHKWAGTDNAAAVVAVVVAAVAAVVAAVVAVAVVAVVAAAYVAAVTGCEDGEKWNKIAFYTFWIEMLVLAFSPLVFSQVPFYASVLPFSLLTGVYLFQGIRRAKAEGSQAPRLLTTQKEVGQFVKSYLNQVVERYAPEVRGKNTELQQSIDALESKRAERAGKEAAKLESVARQLEAGDEPMPA